MLVRRLAMLPVECVARGYLAGSGWRDYAETGEVCGHRLPPGLRQARPPPRAHLHPGHEGHRGTRSQHHPGGGGRDGGRRRARPRPSGSPWPSTRRAAERLPPRRAHPGRHQVRAGARSRGAAGAGRRGAHARLLAPVAGRPVGARGRARPPSTSSTCATGSTGSAGTTPRRRPSCRPRWSRARARGTWRPTSGSRRWWGDPGGGDGDAEGRGARPPGPGGGRGARAARVRRGGRGAHRQAHRARDRRATTPAPRPARCATSCWRTP